MNARLRDLDASLERAGSAREVQQPSGKVRASGARTIGQRPDGRIVPDAAVRVIKRAPSRLGGSAVRIAFGLVWLVDASMKWLPGFRSSFVDAIKGAADGQPSWLHGWFAFWINLLTPRASFFAYLVALTETTIALALIFGFARKLTYVSAIAFSLLIWSTAEGFGGPYRSGASDIGTAVIYAVVFLALLVVNARSEPSRHSVDAWLERRWPWWHRVAEVGGPGTHMRRIPSYDASSYDVRVRTGPTHPTELAYDAVMIGQPEGEGG